MKIQLVDEDILFIIDKISPKIKKCLYQTTYNYREDLEQELHELIIKTLKKQTINHKNLPGLFEYLELH
jgi:hypothetical protein